MKELLVLDSGLKKAHKYKVYKDNCFELPRYLIEDNENFKYFVQFDKIQGMKIYSLNSRSLDKNLPIIKVRVNEPKNIMISGYESNLELFLESIELYTKKCESDVADFCITNSDKTFDFYKFDIEEDYSESTKKWWEFWK